MALLSEALMNTTVCIGEGSQDKIKWMATGFFVSKKAQKGGSYIYLVSNRHVFENKEKIFIRLMYKGASTCSECEIALKINGVDQYAVSPNRDIDVAVILLNGKFIDKNIDKIKSFDIDDNTMTSSDYLLNGGYAGSGVFMPGFPMGLIDKFTTSPICRQGCIARLSNNEIKKHQKFLLDIQNFPGNSGSPIISKPEIVALKGTKPILSCYLIGIVFGYLTYSDALISNQTKLVVSTTIENSGLAIANPSECFVDLITSDLISKNLI